MRKIICMILVSMMIISIALAAPLAVAVQPTALGPSSPMKMDDIGAVESMGDIIAPSAGASKWALIIGIADYKGTESDLWHPDEDAKEMYSELVNQQGYAKKNIKLLTNRQATASAISNAITWLVSNEKAGDEVVFFYSGHGFRASDSEGWDSDVETDGYDEGMVSYDLYGLPDGWLKQKFANIESTKFALMFGSCHSGGMFDDNDDLQGNGRIIATACEADQYGWDYWALGNTLWAYHFVDQGLLDNNADSIEAAFAYAKPFVVAEQPDSIPQLYDNFDGDFLI